jgi:hypothetical protein
MEVAMRLLISAVAFPAIGFAMQMTSDAHAKSGQAASRDKQLSHVRTIWCNARGCYSKKGIQRYRPAYYRPEYHRNVGREWWR